MRPIETGTKQNYANLKSQCAFLLQDKVQKGEIAIKREHLDADRDWEILTQEMLNVYIDEKSIDGKLNIGSITCENGISGGGDLSSNVTVGLSLVGSPIPDTGTTYYRVKVDKYGRVISGNTSDANYYPTGLTVTTATTSCTITVSGNNAAVKKEAIDRYYEVYELVNEKVS